MNRKPAANCQLAESFHPVGPVTDADRHPAAVALSQLFQHSLDLYVLELDDLLLAVVDEAPERGEQGVPWLEQERHVRRRK